jgi:hypothetical protein
VHRDFLITLYLCVVAVLSHTISPRGVTLCVIFQNVLFYGSFYFIFVKNLLLNVCTEFAHIVGLCPPVAYMHFSSPPRSTSAFIFVAQMTVGDNEDSKTWIGTEV